MFDILFSHMLQLDLPFFDAHPTGRLVTRLTNDIQNMHEMFTSVLVTIFNDLLRLAGIQSPTIGRNNQPQVATRSVAPYRRRESR